MAGFGESVLYRLSNVCTCYILFTRLGKGTKQKVNPCRNGSPRRAMQDAPDAIQESGSVQLEKEKKKTRDSMETKKREKERKKERKDKSSLEISNHLSMGKTKL